MSYLVITGLLVGVYLAVVAITTEALPLSSPVGVAASTLAAAAAFTPVRRRVQRLVDRRFNRARYNADATVSAFAVRLRDPMNVDAVRADLLATVNRAVEPAQITMWVAPSAGR